LPKQYPDIIIAGKYYEGGEIALAEGAVKWFNEKKGTVSSSRTAAGSFVHYTAITGDGFKTLAEGQRSGLRWKKRRKAPRPKTSRSSNLFRSGLILKHPIRQDGVFFLPDPCGFRQRNFTTEHTEITELS